MLSCNSMMPNLLLEFDTSDFENCKHSLKMSDEQFPTVRISQNHHMSIVQSFCVFVHVFQFHLSSWVKSDVVENHHQLTQKIVNFYGWFELRCDEYLDGPIVLQYFVELVEHSLIILFNELLSSFLFVLNSDGLLPHFRRQFLPLFLLLHFDLVLNHSPLIVNLDSFDFILDLIGLLFVGSMELAYRLRPWLHYFILGFGSLLFFMRLWLHFFYHC